MLLLNVGCFTLAQKLHGNCPHTYTLGSNVITSVEEEQERDLGIGLLFKAIHESLKHSSQCAVATKSMQIYL